MENGAQSRRVMGRVHSEESSTNEKVKHKKEQGGWLSEALRQSMGV
jgi:hypothetical protein